MSFFKENTSLSNELGKISDDIDKNIMTLQEYFCHTEDLMKKELRFHNQKCVILYLESLVKKELLQSSIIEPIIEMQAGEIEKTVHAAEIKQTSMISEAGKQLLDGACMILIENNPQAYLASVGGIEGRSLQEPNNERSIKSAHDGFVESFSSNLQLLRKRIKSPRLKVKYFTIGNLSNTKVGMVYLDKLANKELIDEVERRLTSIELDQLYLTGDVEELIEDHPFSPFPQILATERPDRAVSYLTEGKITIIVDGNPRVLVVPITFFAFYQAPDDYNSRWLIGSFFRITRLFSFIIAISLPAIYIAIVSFHSEVLPIGILYSIRTSLEYVPFPPFVEALTMQIILELLKEASIRLPSPIAQTIGIVGGLVIGTAVVDAHIVSNMMIVVIGITAIASFVAPINEMGTSARLLGFPTMLAASLLGFFGIVFVLMLIFMHLSKLDSFGTPYFAPLAPFKKEDLKDSFIRLPFWKLTTRPMDARPAYAKQLGRTRTWKKK
ncbi:spore germination protein KA [Bacillus sp. OV166]|uniref:spore germination protein n=1 Tax=Bacillus sp. OV166 TaxID=1882763 RepID=UPI000A2AE6E0|nr:spore germination protein [Bacillus sp. OV166]SMQ84920.1 spore germination protein KA [Bacillus sp. OV166]